jgi:hypothetical protein
VRGTRECACGVPYWVDKCASYMDSVARGFANWPQKETPRQWHARKNHAFCAPRGLAEGFDSARSAAGDFLPIKKGVKAKPLSAKVSIDLPVQRAAENLQHARRSV